MHVRVRARARARARVGLRVSGWTFLGIFLAVAGAVVMFKPWDLYGHSSNSSSSSSSGFDFTTTPAAVTAGVTANATTGAGAAPEVRTGQSLSDRAALFALVMQNLATCKPRLHGAHTARLNNARTHVHSRTRTPADRQGVGRVPPGFGVLHQHEHLLPAAEAVAVGVRARHRDSVRLALFVCLLALRGALATACVRAPCVRACDISFVPCRRACVLCVVWHSRLAPWVAGGGNRYSYAFGAGIMGLVSLYNVAIRNYVAFLLSADALEALAFAVAVRAL
jgi:hypothetical protein